MRSLHLLIASDLSIFLFGCTPSLDIKDTNIPLPEWVVMPNIDNGLADSACVPFSGHFTIDRNQATAEARNSLVRQIELKAANMVKTYGHKTDTVSGSNIGANFETSARQIAEATLQGSKAIKTDVFDIDGRKNLCVLVTLEPEKTKAVFANIVKSSGAELASNDERVLYEEFKAFKAQQELIQELPLN
ncbi:MAG: hypothetical protein CL693_16770 [Cellvibrionaceae bacterium]|nr:hypothetical protein [Cellvibrionaceae bacterium]|tara:strand:+ start:16824 stop:17390 length:567 start_codon:yes stop_codon:yes gene_type:complete